MNVVFDISLQLVSNCKSFQSIYDLQSADAGQLKSSVGRDAGSGNASFADNSADDKWGIGRQISYNFLVHYMRSIFYPIVLRLHIKYSYCEPRPPDALSLQI